MLPAANDEDAGGPASATRSTGTTRPRSRLARGGDLYPLLAIGPYAVLLVAVGYTLFGGHITGTTLIVDLTLCAVTAAWMLGMFTIVPHRQDSPAAMGIFVTGMLLLIGTMVLQAPWFGFLAIAGYLYVFALIPWPQQLIAIVFLGIVGATAQTAGLDRGSIQGILDYLGVIALNVVVMGGFSWINWSTMQQDHRRQLLLAEVRDANRRLEDALAENAVLHERLIAQARHAGAIAERQRLAREIHDTVAQGLIGVITQLQAAEQADDPTAAAGHVDAAGRIARESLVGARRSVHALRPEPLESQRLDGALRDIAARWSELQRVPVETTIAGDTAVLPPNTEIVLVRVAQESLANVAKHAHASRVGLTLSYFEHDVVLDVRDDGTGFDPARPSRASEAEPATSGGFGLVAMRERVEELDGELTIESEPGSGTAVSARLPREVAHTNVEWRLR